MKYKAADAPVTFEEVLMNALHTKYINVEKRNKLLSFMVNQKEIHEKLSGVYKSNKKRGYTSCPKVMLKHIMGRQSCYSPPFYIS